MEESVLPIEITKEIGGQTLSRVSYELPLFAVHNSNPLPYRCGGRPIFGVRSTLDIPSDLSMMQERLGRVFRHAQHRFKPKTFSRPPDK